MNVWMHDLLNGWMNDKKKSVFLRGMDVCVNEGMKEIKE